MKTSSVSTLALQNALRLQVQTTQNQLTQAQTEASTGQYADFGLSLGAGVSTAVNLSNSVNQLQTIVNSNSLVNTRLSSAQDALSQLGDNAQTILNGLISVNSTTSSSQIQSVTSEITDAFQSSISTTNLSANGEYLFGGTNVGTAPLNDYFSSGSTAKTAFDNAFSSYFGFSEDSSQVADITGTQMSDFLDNVVTPMFEGSDWQTDWSNATDQGMTSRISTNEVITSSTTANSEGIRKLAMASVVSVELLGKSLSGDARTALTSFATTTAGDAITAINADQSQLGVAQSRVSSANDSLNDQINLVKTQMSDLESVDSYDAATQVNTLSNQLETSYELTSRISQLSLLNYL